MNCQYHIYALADSGVARICREEGQSLKLLSWDTYAALQGRVQQLFDD